MIHLFNTENYKDKPFQTFTIENETREIKSMKFSPNGKYILLGTRDNVIMLLDAFKGSMVRKLEGNFSSSEVAGSPCGGDQAVPFLKHVVNLECGFSPDSRYVISGSANPRKNVLIWNIDTGAEVSLTQFHPTTVQCAKFSHVFCMLVTACQNVVVWIPGSIVTQ
jgi:WD40 repeat protein